MGRKRDRWANGLRSTSIFDRLEQAQADRFRVPDSAVPPLDLEAEMQRLEAQEFERYMDEQMRLLQESWQAEIWKRTMSVDWLTPRRPQRFASRVLGGFTESATSSGPIEHSTSALDAAMAAATKLRPRLTHSGMDPLAEWSKMRTSETTPPTSPTSTDSPDESP